MTREEILKKCADWAVEMVIRLDSASSPQVREARKELVDKVMSASGEKIGGILEEGKMVIRDLLAQAAEALDTAASIQSALEETGYTTVLDRAIREERVSVQNLMAERAAKLREMN